MSDIDVRSIWVGSTASITTFHHELLLLPGSYPEFYQNSKSLVLVYMSSLDVVDVNVVKQMAVSTQITEITLDWTIFGATMTAP